MCPRENWPSVGLAEEATEGRVGGSKADLDGCERDLTQGIQRS